MRLSQIKIKNFRSFEDETILFDDYTCFVGPNGTGKSTVVQALNIFFRNTSASSLNLFTLSEEDFHHKNINDPIEITLVFEHLSPEAQEDFKSYFRNNKLIVSAKAIWNPNTNNAEVKQHGSRLVMEDFVPFFKALENKKTPVSEFRTIYGNLREKYSDLPRSAGKPDMENALRTFEEAHPELCEPQYSPTQFYGWSKGENRLRKYLQWVFVPAVKDTSTEQEEGKTTALGQLLERTVRTKVNFRDSMDSLRQDVEKRYTEILEKEKSSLDSISTSLTNRIQNWTHSGTQINLKWYYNPDKSFTVNEPLARLEVGEHAFLGEVARLGHGLQRTVFVSLLQELSENEEGNQPTLLLGFEEPELYQHPPQARHMANLLQDLSRKNSQIILTTHSPYFVLAKGYENIRMVRKSPDDRKSMVTQITHKEISERLAQALCEPPRSPTSTMAAIEQIMQPSQNELFFATKVILVEGLEDIAFITTHLHLSGKWNQFRSKGCHFVISEGKQSLSRPLAIAKALDIPTFVVFDSDADANRGNPGDNLRNNKCILSLCGLTESDPMPQETLWSDNLVMWHSNIMDVVRNAFGPEFWDTAEKQAKKQHGFMDGIKRKNSMLIAATLEELKAQGKQSTVLEILCTSILEFAKDH